MENIQKTVTFTNGESAEHTFPVGTYKASEITIPGYEEGASLENFTVTKDGGTITLQLVGGGTLQVQVVDEEGDPIEGARLQFSSQSGDLHYGSELTTGINGVAVFRNVPYDADKNVTLWIDQLASDGAHMQLQTPTEVVMDSAGKTVRLVNPTNAPVSLKLVDKNYGYMVPLTGDITFTGTVPAPEV